MTDTNMDQIIRTVYEYLCRNLEHAPIFDEENREIFFESIAPKSKIVFTEAGFTTFGLVIPPMGADEENIKEAALFLTYVNYGRKYGNFSLNLEDGEVNIVVHQNCRGMQNIPDEIIKDTLTFIHTAFFFFTNSIFDILLGFSDAATEIAKLNGQQE